MRQTTRSFVGKAACSALVVALAYGSPATVQISRADDTELFMYAPGQTVPAPNALIILDTSSNWGATVGGVKLYTIEVAALGALANYFATTGPTGLSRGNINVGLMPGTSGSVDGGYARYGLRNMLSADNRAGWLATVSTMDNTEKSNNPTPSSQYYEAFQYFTGGTVVSGGDNGINSSAHRDYHQNSDSRSAWGAHFANSSPRPGAGSFPLASSTATTYQAPASMAASCAKNYIIYISNGQVSGNQTSETKTACNYLTQVGGDATTIPLNPNNFQASCMDEWARFLYKKDFASSTQYAGMQNVATYTIEILPSSNPTGQAMTASLKSMANVGGGAYYPITNVADSTQLEAALVEIFSQIQAVNSVFASVSLPVSVNQRSTNLNQVYIGVFRPDGQDRPRWPGNLKEYQLGYDAGTQSLMLVDAKTDPANPASSAVDSKTGFLRIGAYSFWTFDDRYWSFAPDPNSSKPASDGPDGPIVERGGAAQLMRMKADGSTPNDPSGRTVYTVTGSASNVALAGCSSCAFATTNGAITQSALGVATATDRDSLIDWVRGANNSSGTSPSDGEYGVVATFGASNVTLDATKVRPSVHGDVLHSRPAVINYNRTGSATLTTEDDVVVFYGSNDGTLRAIQGGRTGGAGTAGAEKWAFVAEEFYPKLDRLRRNSPPITPPGAPAPVTLSGGSVKNGSNEISGLSLSAINTLRLNMTAEGLSAIPAGAYIVGFQSCSGNSSQICIALSQDATADASGSITFKPSLRPYFFDGAVTTWVKDANGDGKITSGSSSDKAYLFASMRRGGRMVYAFDVTNPDQPVLLWSKGCRSETGTSSCDSGWEEMGQSWSAATAVSINASLSSGNPYNVALTFGAGYDSAVDDQDPATGTRSMGRGIYIVDAVNGSIVRKFVSPSSPSASSSNTASVSGMDYSIPSDVAVVARSHLTNDLSNAHRAYVGDTGGNVWRLDIGNTDPDKWVITKLASLGGPGANQRKFLFPPDIVFGGRDSTGGYDYVLIGSGDREHPFNGLVDGSGNSLNVNYPSSIGVTNRFYMIKDRDIRENYHSTDKPTSGGLTEASLYDATQDLVQSADASAAGAASSSLDTQQGWYITMEGVGEKVVGGATTVAGAVFFGTNRPIPSTANTCGFNLGEAKLYSVDITTAGAIKNYFAGSASLSAAARFTILPGGGLPPTPVPVSVQIGDNKVEGIISGTQVRATGTGVGSRLRSFIRIIHDKRLPW